MPLNNESYKRYKEMLEGERSVKLNEMALGGMKNLNKFNLARLTCDLSMYSKLSGFLSALFLNNIITLEEMNCEILELNERFNKK